MPPLLRRLGRLPDLVITLLMLVAMADMLAGVFLRYVMTRVAVLLDRPPIGFFWVEEVGEWALAWMMFVAAAIGIRRGAHFGVHMLVDRLPAALARAVAVTHALLMAVFGALVVWFGWEVAELNSLAFSPALGLNYRWLYLSAVAGGGLIVLYSVAAALDVWRGRPAVSSATSRAHAAGAPEA